MPKSNEDTLIHWLILSLTPQLGPVRIAHLLEHFGSVNAIISAGYHQLHQLGFTHQTTQAITHPDQRKLEQALNWQQQNDHHIITQDSCLYPSLLKQIAAPPTVLYLVGNPTLLASHQLAIVGSRKPTPAGEQIAFDFANQLSQFNVHITSGLAFGIDGAAHRGALANHSATLAVLGSGVDNIYPKKHIQLAKQISEQGALISELALSTPPLAHHFPRRNRIISGLSLGTLVVEAALKSGSLITAHCAADQGRDVFALPGSVHNPQAAGTHYLIQQGAQLVTQYTDIAQELKLNCNLSHQNKKKSNQNNKLIKLDKDHHNLLQYVKFAPTALDEICIHHSMETATLNSMLLHLELHGYVKKVPGGYLRVK